MSIIEKDVVIVGAGLSGLAAAYEIHTKSPDTSVAVLEANPTRVGGRNYVDADGVDLGAGYIGPMQDRLMRLVDDLGLVTYKVYTAGSTIQVNRGCSTPFEGIVPPLSFLGLLDLNAAMVAMERIVETINLQQPHLTVDADALDRMTVQQWIDSHCWTNDAANVMRTCVRAVLCVEPSNVSVLGFCWYCCASGNLKRVVETRNGAQDSKVEGGTGRISLELAKRLPNGWIHLGAAVRSIDMMSKDVVVLKGDRFGEIRAKTVILAIPPVQQLRIEYSPPLPPNRISGLQRHPMGHIIKTFTSYARPFWREKQLNGSIVSADDGISVVAIDDSKPDGSHFQIMCFVLSVAASAWAERTPAERSAAIAAHLAKAYGTNEALHPIGYKEKNWAEEPFVGGCYVGVPAPMALTQYASIVQQPRIADHVFIAGTESARGFVGYMDGAVEAGERSARNALVQLGKLPAEAFETSTLAEPSPQMPYVDMQISWAERYLVLSVPQALFVGAAASALGAAAAVWWLKFKK